jgi:anti-sigma-K factor RskA
MGTLMLLRQVGAAIAIAAAATVYAGALHDGLGHAQPAVATGHAVFAVTVAGAAIAVAALLSLPRAATRLAPLAAPVAAPA